jgi:hypothetical protein
VDSSDRFLLCGPSSLLAACCISEFRLIYDGFSVGSDGCNRNRGVEIGTIALVDTVIIVTEKILF